MWLMASCQSGPIMGLYTYTAGRWYFTPEVRDTGSKSSRGPADASDQRVVAGEWPG